MHVYLRSSRREAELGNTLGVAPLFTYSKASMVACRSLMVVKKTEGKL